MTDLSTEALMARRKLAEQASSGGWSAITRADINGCLVCDIIDERGVELADSLTQEAASHIVSNDPSTVIATIDELVRLRAECARLEREAGWLALVLANACCGVPLSEYIDMDINCMSPPAPEHWRDAARKAVEES